MQPDRGTPPQVSESPAQPGWPTVAAVIAGAVALHLNYWLWDADGLVLGLPVNMFYHVVLTVVLAALMWALVRWRWPRYLDDGVAE